MDYHHKFPPGQPAERSHPQFPRFSVSRYEPSDGYGRNLETNNRNMVPQGHVSITDQGYNGYDYVQPKSTRFPDVPVNNYPEPSQHHLNVSQPIHKARPKSDLSSSSDSLDLQDKQYAPTGSEYGQRVPSYPLAPYESPQTNERLEIPPEANGNRYSVRTSSVHSYQQAPKRQQTAPKQVENMPQPFWWGQEPPVYAQNANWPSGTRPMSKYEGYAVPGTHQTSEDAYLPQDITFRPQISRGPTENRVSMHYPEDNRASYARYSHDDRDDAAHHRNSSRPQPRRKSRQHTQSRRQSLHIGDDTEDEMHDYSYHKTLESDGAVYFEKRHVPVRRPPIQHPLQHREPRIYEKEDADNDKNDIPPKKPRGNWLRSKFEKLTELGSLKRRASSKRRKKVSYLPLPDERHFMRLTGDADKTVTNALELGLGYGHYTDEQLHSFWRIIAEAICAPKPAVDRLNRILPRLGAEDIRAVREDYRHHVHIKDDNGEYQPVYLSKQMASTVGGYFGEICTAVALGRFRSELFFIEKYYHQEIPRRDFLIEGLVGRTNPEMEAIVKAFMPERYHSRLGECLADELEGDTKRQAALFRALTNPRDDERRPVDREAIELTVDAMYKVLNSKEGGDEKMVAALMNRNSEYLREFLRRYKSLHGVSFGAEVLKKCSSFVAEVLAHLFNGAVNRQLRDAMYLNFALHECRETHANEESIVLLTSRLVRYHWEPVHMMHVDATYQSRFNISLRQDLMDLIPFHENRELPNERADYRHWLDFCIGLVVSSSALGKRIVAEGD